MNADEPIVELDGRYSTPDAKPTPWDTAGRQLDDAGVYWLSTVRPDARPHVTPVAAVWMDGSLYFATGPDERKARNLERNTHCVITTGCNRFDEGLDVVVEGDAVRIEDENILGRLADRFESKYKGVFGFKVHDSAFVHDEGGVALVFEVAPVKAFSYLRAEDGSATRYRFRLTR
jgi:nitroimidazol reductase NimA-like FMN-containing flavoprotein (pyridoxamine 5'-phosphate oxidase superfamily)